MNEKQDSTFAILESRISKLEEKVLGRGNNYAEIQENSDVISSLSEFSCKLGNALSTRDRMMMVMKRLEELERYMDPSYGEFDVGDDVKADLILVQEQSLNNQYQMLTNISSMKKCLDSQVFADSAPTLNADFQKLYHRFVETEKLTNEQNIETVRIIENYSAIINTLTETCSKMDKIVTQAEIAAQPKKILD